MNITVKQDGITIVVIIEGTIIRFDSWEEAIEYVIELTKLKTKP